MISQQNCNFPIANKIRKIMPINASDNKKCGIGKATALITATINATNTTQTDIQLINITNFMRGKICLKGFPFLIITPIYSMRHLSWDGRVGA